MKKSLSAMVIVLALVVMGCHGEKKTKPIQYTPDSQFNPDYKEVFEIWTREDRIYKGFDCKLIAAATFKSIQFRRAYTEEYSKLYKLNPTEKTIFLKDQEDAAATYNEFVFAAYVPEKKWDDFSKKKSTWKFHLYLDEDTRVTPAEIRKLERNNVVLKHFFPYVTPWKSIYLLRFPARCHKTGEALMSDHAGTLRLSVSSVLGSAEMVWDLNGGSD